MLSQSAWATFVHTWHEHEVYGRIKSVHDMGMHDFSASGVHRDRRSRRREDVTLEASAAE